MNLAFNIAGIIGAGLVVSAYFLLQTKKIHSDQLIFLSMNICGSMLLLASLLWDWNLPSFIIEITWLLISLFGFYKWIINYKSLNK